jgi:hypothetical protein
MNIKRALEIFGFDSLNDLNSEELKKVYRKLAKERHPDKMGGTNKDFVELRRAYLLLYAEAEKNDDTQKTLKELSKDEILDKYYQETRDLKVKMDTYEDIIGNQSRTLSIVRESVEQIVERFEYRKQQLKKDLELTISSLERQLKPNIVQKLFSFLWPKLNEDEFWLRYQQQVKNYTRKDQDLNMEFFKEMLTIYGDGLNDISSLINLKDEK